MSAASYLAKATKDLSCPLCQEIFVDPQTPKQLMCSHVYCQICLEKMTDGGLSEINCPQCHAITSVPPKTPTSDGGIAELKSINQLQNLAENHLQHIDTLKESMSSESEPRQRNVPFCPEHEEEKMYFYCLRCDELVCQACLVLDHDKIKHQIVGVKAVYKEQIAEMRKLITKTSDDFKCEDLHEVVEKQKKQTEETMIAKDQEIDQAIAEIVTHIYKQGENMKKQIRKYTIGRIQVCQKLEHDIGEFRNLQSQVENTMEKASPYEYLELHQSLVEKIKNTHIDAEQLDEIHAKEFKIVASPAEQMLCIVRKRQIHQSQMFNYHLRDEDDIKVCGGKVTFALYTSKYVSIYCKENAIYNHHLDHFATPFSVLEVMNNKQFLIATDNSVHVHTIAGHCEKTFCSKQGMEQLTNITRFLDGKVVLGDIGRKTLTMYRPDGNLMKTVQVGLTPVCLAAMKASHVAVCNASMSWKPAELCIYDMDTGKQILRVDVPGIKCMCYDKQSDCLIVGRSDKKIVQYWVKPWTFIKEIGEIEGVPFSMAFADADDLVISTVGNGIIHVYKCIG